MTNFKEWFQFSESVIVDDNGVEASLQIVDPHYIYEFNYHGEQLYSTFFIALYQAKRIGYLSMGSSPTHIGITKTSNLPEGSGVDISFIKDLTHKLQAGGLRPVQYKEGDDTWISPILQKNNIQTPQNDYQNTQTPEFSKGSTNSQKLSGGVSISKASGSWSFFARVNSDSYAIKRVLEIMKQSAKPLLDNNFIDFYEIIERNSGKRVEIQYSQSGKRQHDQHKTNWDNSVGYLKYLNDVLLSNRPKAKKLVLNAINGVGVRVSGGGDHPALAVNPVNMKIPYEQLSQFIDHSYGENGVLKYFIKAAFSDNDRMYSIIELASDTENPRLALYYADKLDNNGFEYITDHEPLIGEMLNIIEYSKFLDQVNPSEFQKLMHNFETSTNDYLRSETHFSPNEIKYIRQLSDHIHIDPALLSQIDQLDQEVKEKEEQKRKEIEEQRKKEKSLIYPNMVSYLVLGENQTEWEEVPNQYLSYRGNDVSLEDFVNREIIDSDVRNDMYSDAYEQAMSEMDPVERPSETYGQDKDRVLEDIDLHYDDFIHDQALDDFPDGADDDAWINLIKEKYLDDFIEWRKEKMAQEEEEGEYENEPDESDVGEIVDEMAVQYAFLNMGLVIMTVDDNKNVQVQLGSQFKEPFMPILKNMVALNIKEKDEYEERRIGFNNHIELDYFDKSHSDTFTASDLK